MKKLYNTPLATNANLNNKKYAQIFPVCEPPTIPIGLAALAIGRAISSVSRALPVKKLKFL